MDHLPQILWYLSFPLTIVVSYYAVVAAITYFRKKREEKEFLKKDFTV